MFGPGVDAAVEAYRNAANDDDLTGLLGLFGSTEQVLARWNRKGETITGINDKGEVAVSVPLREPVKIRPAYDKLYQITRVNCP
jgi:nitrate reductase beta subunit